MFSDDSLNRCRGYLTDYVNSITKHSPNGGRNMYCCPICGSGTGNGGKSRPTGAFSIAPDKQHWKCFACGTGGDIFDLVREVEKIETFTKQVAFVADRYGVPLEEVKEKDSGRQAKPKIESDYGFHEATEAGKKAAQHVIDAAQQHAAETDYFQSRGLSDETVERFRLGFSADSQQIFIPYGTDTSYFATRRIGEKAYRKLPSDVYGSEPLFNKDALYCGEPCFICEGPFDAMSIEQSGGKAVSIGGNAFWKLIRCIRKQRPDDLLILSLDNDDPGRDMQIKLAALLRNENIPFMEAQYSLDDYRKNKDANDMLQSNPQKLKEDVAENIAKAKEKGTEDDLLAEILLETEALKAGENELRRCDAEAQQRVQFCMEPNENGYFQIPADGGKFWQFGISPGKYGPYVKVGNHIFPVNTAGYIWVRQGGSKEGDFKEMLQTMLSMMQKQQKEKQAHEMMM